MPTIAMFGAGELGGALAYTLARRQWSGQIVLIDESAGSVAAGKALDIVEAAPIDGSDTMVTGTADLHRAAGCDLVVLADRVAGGEWSGDGGLALVKRIVDIAPRAPIVFAGASQAPLMELAVRELRLDRRRLIGSAPAAFEGAAIALAAADLNAAATDVRLFAVGAPRRLSVAWSSATLHGQPMAAFLDAHQIARIDARLPALWPPGPYALASAASRVCEAIVGDSRRFLTSFVVLDRELGARDRAAAIPVRVGPRGVLEVTLPALSARERTKFENALA